MAASSFRSPRHPPFFFAAQATPPPRVHVHGKLLVGARVPRHVHATASLGNARKSMLLSHARDALHVGLGLVRACCLGTPPFFATRCYAWRALVTSRVATEAAVPRVRQRVTVAAVSSGLAGQDKLPTARDARTTLAGLSTVACRPPATAATALVHRNAGAFVCITRLHHRSPLFAVFADRSASPLNDARRCFRPGWRPCNSPGP